MDPETGIGVKRARSGSAAYISPSTWLDEDHEEPKLILCAAWEDMKALTDRKPCPVQLASLTLGIPVSTNACAVAEANRLGWAAKLHGKAEYAITDVFTADHEFVMTKLPIIKGRIARYDAHVAAQKAAARIPPPGPGLSPPKAECLLDFLNEDAGLVLSTAAPAPPPPPPDDETVTISQMVGVLRTQQQQIVNLEQSVNILNQYVAELQLSIYDPHCVALYNFPVSDSRDSRDAAKAKVHGLLTALGLTGPADDLKTVFIVQPFLLKLLFKQPNSQKTILDHSRLFSRDAWTGRADGPGIIQAFDKCNAKMAKIYESKQMLPKFDCNLSVQKWSRLKGGRELAPRSPPRPTAARQDVKHAWAD